MNATIQTQAKTPPPSSAPVQTHFLQRKCACGGSAGLCGQCDSCETERLSLQRRPLDQSKLSRVPTLVEEALSSSGSPIDLHVRSQMEARFGHNFSQVRVHSDGLASESARAVNAQAYTVGHDVVFGAGQYEPETSGGQRLLAHELAHVVQQGGQRHYNAKALFGHQTDRFEREADAAADAVVSGRNAKVGHAGSTPLIQGNGLIGTLSCALVQSPDTGAPLCVNMGGCTGSCVLHNNFPIPPFCTCVGGLAIPTPLFPPTPLPLPPPTLPFPFPIRPPAPGPAPAPPPVPALPPPPPVVLRGLEVENSRESITRRVPSIVGAAGKEHWVTVASLAGTHANVRAIVDPVVPPADPRVAGLTWTLNGAATAAGGDVLHLSIQRNAGKKVVQATLNGLTRELTIWAVFANIATAGPANPVTDLGPSLQVHAPINLTATIIPSQIVTEADHPNLEGANTVPPPGGTNSCGGALAGGVDHHWDMSRQIRMRNIDPAGHLPLGCVDTVGGAYPANNVEGNDDAGTADETNDPYASGGTITSGDDPTRTFPHAIGADGDTIEQHLQFREFARLEYDRTWWTISHTSPWRFHIRIRRVGGRWVDNGTDSATDNAGF